MKLRMTCTFKMVRNHLRMLLKKLFKEVVQSFHQLIYNLLQIYEMNFFNTLVTGCESSDSYI